LRRRRLREEKTKARRQRKLVGELKNNYRVFFDRMCNLPFWERLKAAARILFKRKFGDVMD